MDGDADPNILGCYHIAMFPGWQVLVAAQCQRLKQSGLLGRTERVLVSVVGGPATDCEWISSLLENKAEIRHVGGLTAYEFPTLERLYQEACRSDFIGWYIHTKGISHGHAAGENHRQQMEETVIDNHAACATVVGSYDACGIHWRADGFGRLNPHFSGNFWWANAKYLRSLPSPLSLDTCNRYEAEFWIGKNHLIKPLSMHVQSDPFGKASAWQGLEAKFYDLCEFGDSSLIRRVVDIGVDYGFSTFHFARQFPKAEVIGIDDFRLHPDAESWVFSHLNLFPNVRIIKGNSAAVGKTFDGQVDLLHIDGDHAFESVVADFCGWLPMVRTGGRIIFHDIEAFPSVRRFFDGLGGRKVEIKQHYGLGCWFKE